MDKTNAGIPNWELCAWVIIGKLLVGKSRNFSRSEFMKIDNVSMAQLLTVALGHKRRPQCAESTLQRTLQNMRDKGYIDFLGKGEYRLTDSGAEKLGSVTEKGWEFDKLMSAYKEFQFG